MSDPHPAHATVSTEPEPRRIAVIGASRGTGRHVVSCALAAGHDVVATARRPESLAIEHERLAVLPADTTDPRSTLRAIEGADIVISTVGPPGRKGPITVLSEGARNLVECMRVTGIRRLLCVSAIGAHEDALVTFPMRLVARFILRPLLREPFADTLRMEAVLRESGLDWTVVRPPRLTDGARTGRYRVSFGEHLPRPSKISRADLADALLALAFDDRALRTCVEVSY